jgi:hypothetical protein
METIKPIIESLETRALFSVNVVAVLTDEATLTAAVKTVTVDVQHYAPAYLADVKTLTSDMKGLPNTKANAQLLAQLVKDQATCNATMKNEYALIVKADTATFAKIMPDVMKAMSDPNDAALNAKLAGELTAAETAAHTQIATFFNDIGACGTTLTADADALVAANPTATKLATDVQAAEAHATAALGTIEQAMVGCETALAKIFADFVG